MIMACFYDPEVEFRGIRDIYGIVDKEKPIFDSTFPKRHGFVAL